MMRNLTFLFSVFFLGITLTLMNMFSLVREQISELQAKVVSLENEVECLEEALAKKPDTIRVAVPTNADVLALARLINSETYPISDKYKSRYSKDELFLGKVAVGDVVMNRVLRYRHSDPKALSAAIKRKGQFDGVKTKKFNKTPSSEDLLAAYMALMNMGVFDAGVEYFHNPVTSTDIRHVSKVSKYKVAHLAGHDFCLNSKHYKP